MTSSPSVLRTRASIGSVRSTSSTKRSTAPTASLVALLLGQARVAGEVGERDRDAQAPEREHLVAHVGLHVTDHVLLDEVREEAPVQPVHDGGREGQQLARHAVHLRGDLDDRKARCA